ncbi:MAG: hypothetical protein ACXVYV_01775 [Gaiellales bacterium]
MSPTSTGRSGLHRSLGGHSLLARYPRAYLAFARRRYGSQRVLDAATELVIEGFPRSANTFAVNAFLLAQPRPVALAHHLHSSAHVIAAARAGVPALVLVRRPQDAIASVLVRKPTLPASRVAEHYIDFHTRIRPWHDRLVVADFGQVTTDFGAVIRRVNATFGTRFAEFEHSPENVRRCFSDIEQHGRSRLAGEPAEHALARPSAARNDARTEAVHRLEAAIAPRTRVLLDAIHAEYLALAGV